MRATAFILVVVAACGTNETPQPEPALELPECVPNRDGRISADELPVAIGATVTNYVATNRTIDQLLVDGRWDFSDERAGDEVAEIGPVALRDQWYAGRFTQGQFVVDAGLGLDGIYHQDAQALWLDGTASREQNPSGGQTLVVYPQPLPVLRFPVQVGDIFTTTAQLDSATINGLPLNGTDELTIEVLEAGVLAVPYVEFSPTLRVRTSAVRRPSSGGMAGRRQTLWLFECFGEVARAESNPNETNPDFSTAAYFRRFALGVTP